MRYWRRHFDRKKTGKAHQEPKNTLSSPFVVSERSKRSGTYGDERPPDKRVQFRKFTGSKNNVVGPKKEVGDSRHLSRKDDNRNQEYSTQQVRVPGKVYGTAFDHIKALLDHNRVHRSYCGTGNTKCNSEQCNWGSIEEDTDEEAECDHRARHKDTEGRPCLQEDVGSRNGERE